MIGEKMISFLDYLLDALDEMEEHKEEPKPTREKEEDVFDKLKIEKFLGEVVRPQIKDVIFNAPATIVKWDDGTKTIVKCGDGDKYDKEKGLALAIAKKYYGNISGWYGKKFAQWLEEKGEKQCSECKCKKQKKEADRKVEYVKLDLDDLKALLGLPF
jgi:hypothetical protein